MRIMQLASTLMRIYRVHGDLVVTADCADAEIDRIDVLQENLEIYTPGSKPAEVFLRPKKRRAGGDKPNE